MGIGDWGLGMGDWAHSPIPNPQSPIPNPQSPSPFQKITHNVINIKNFNYFIHFIINFNSPVI